MASSGDLFENDENLQPSALNIQDRPSDSDRARFGFKPRLGGQPKPTQATKKDAQTPCCGVDLQKVLRDTLGDPDSILPVLKLKPTAGKYDFKDKIADLQAMICPLKNALSDQRLKAIALAEGLAAAEQEVSAKLRSSREDLKEVTTQLASLQKEAASREAVLEKQLSQECSRTARLQQDLEEARTLASRHADDAASSRRRCEEMSERHRRQMEEAAALLRLRVDETMQAKEQLVEAHKKKEAALIADFSKAKEALQHEHQRRLSELERAQESKDFEAAKSVRQLDEALRAKDAKLHEKEQEMEDRMAGLHSIHAAEISEREGRQKQKEDELQAAIEDLKAAHQLTLDERERKEADWKETMERLAAQHQLQLTERDKLLKRQEHEASECIANLKTDHQSQLEEKEELFRRKESALQANVQSLQQQADAKDASSERARLAWESRLVDKESAWKQAEEALRQQLAAKETTLHETLQSLQFLRASTTEQLQWERQRSQSLEEEAAKLRRRADELRSSELAYSHKVQQQDSELAHLRDQLHELRKTLQLAETERDLQMERASEHQAALQEEIAQSKIKVGTLREELESSKASINIKQQQCEKLQQERNALEVEFRSYKEHHGTSNQQQMEAITELRLTVDKLSKQVECTKAELHSQQGNISRHQGYIQSLESQLAVAECTRRELHNVIQELKGNIRVFCRLRPQFGSSGASQHLQVAENKLNLDHMNEQYGFSFDRVFAESSSQEAIFEEVRGLVQSALDGFKVSIFAYGQTGSGKTYTMQGSSTPGALGLIPRSIQQILQASEAMKASGWAWTLKVSFLEVYNEVLRDLLGSEGSNLVHVIKHDDAWGTVVTNLTLMEVSHMEQISKLMETASRARSVGATDMNASSSRSHSIFALYLHGVNREQRSELHGALHLVDLAGSERLDKSGSTGERLKETQNINRSLSSLADVFLAKAEGRSHIPFRNSKLTHLMEPCLNGQGKTLMLVTISPEADHAHETLCSLRFASQVSQCTTGGKPKRHLRPVANGNASTAKLASSRSFTSLRHAK